ncbi:MAG: ParB/RepB/Spo0J family partition protein [Bacilli bacterium]|nr:ParB/RepB/Spo0J family partition protein [Bacilli bacterium]
MKKNKERILTGSLSDLVAKFSQQNIIAEIEKRYQSAPARLIPISMIDDCAYISKVKIPDETLEYFASRLKEKGFYNPLVVRTKEDGHYEVILGRKRFYGAAKAGMLSLPCAFAEVEDEEMLLMLLADTRDQREANVVEMALVCRALQEDFGYTQNTLAALSHQSRCQITNILRILKLPEDVVEAVCLGKMSYGQARALSSLNEEDARRLFNRIIDEGLSVRQVEALAKSLRSPAKGKEKEYSVIVEGKQLRIEFVSEGDLIRFLKAKHI